MCFTESSHSTTINVYAPCRSLGHVHTYMIRQNISWDSDPPIEAREIPIVGCRWRRHSPVIPGARSHIVHERRAWNCKLYRGKPWHRKTSCTQRRNEANRVVTSRGTSRSAWTTLEVNSRRGHPRIQMVTTSRYNLRRVCDPYISWWVRCNCAHDSRIFKRLIPTIHRTGNGAMADLALGELSGDQTEKVLQFQVYMLVQFLS